MLFWFQTTYNDHCVVIDLENNVKSVKIIALYVIIIIVAGAYLYMRVINESTKYNVPETEDCVTGQLRSQGCSVYAGGRCGGVLGDRSVEAAVSVAGRQYYKVLLFQG